MRHILADVLMNVLVFAFMYFMLLGIMFANTNIILVIPLWIIAGIAGAGAVYIENKEEGR